MNVKPIRVLLIEDSQFFVQLVKLLLRDAKHGEFDLNCVESVGAGLERLAKGGIDVILLDLTLPDSAGLETFDRVHQMSEGVPIVIFTSLDDEELSLTALQRGAADYLVKSEVNANWLARSLIYALQRKRTEERVQKTVGLETSRQGILDVQKPREGDDSIIAHIGVRKLVSVVALEHAKLQFFKLLEQRHGKRLLLDFGNVEYVSNVAISTLLSVHKKSKTYGKSLVLCNVSPQVREQFASRRFDTVLDIREESSDKLAGQETN